MLALLAMVALVVDIGYAKQYRRQAQNSADAAALAAAQDLTGTASGATTAVATAKAWALKNDSQISAASWAGCRDAGALPVTPDTASDNRCISFSADYLSIRVRVPPAHPADLLRPVHRPHERARGGRRRPRRQGARQQHHGHGGPVRAVPDRAEQHPQAGRRAHHHRHQRRGAGPQPGPRRHQLRQPAAHRVVQPAPERRQLLALHLHEVGQRGAEPLRCGDGRLHGARRRRQQHQPAGLDPAAAQPDLPAERDDQQRHRHAGPGHLLLPQRLQRERRDPPGHRRDAGAGVRGEVQRLQRHRQLQLQRRHGEPLGTDHRPLRRPLDRGRPDLRRPRRPEPLQRQRHLGRWGVPQEHRLRDRHLRAGPHVLDGGQRRPGQPEPGLRDHRQPGVPRRRRRQLQLGVRHRQHRPARLRPGAARPAPEGGPQAPEVRWVGDQLPTITRPFM
ncbi:hypothetical protein KSP35_13310 [Aquihabitans sp. G128]|nr:hypothetical protein KSP35_13310 [Aquihabitans sp. G128]